MSIVKRKGSPFWNYDFQIDGIQFRGATPHRCDTVKKQTAKLWEDAQKIKTREELAERRLFGDDNPATLTIDAAFGRYYEEVGRHRSDAKDIFRDLARIQDFFGSVIEKKTRPKLMADITDNHVAKLIAWRRSHQVDRHRGTNGTYAPIPSDPPVQGSTVNRSCTGRLSAVFARAGNVWFKNHKIPFPHEPGWSEHKLPEIDERVRVVKVAEHEIIEDTFDDDYEPLYRFYVLSGLRLKEALIAKAQIEPALGVINVTRKGGKKVTTMITPAIAEIIADRWPHHPDMLFTYVAKRDQDKIVKGKRVVLIKGKRYPITKAGLKTYWRRRRAEMAKAVPTLLSADGKSNLRIHDLRHTFGTNVQTVNGDQRLTQKLMAHAKGETTEKYTHVFNKAMYQGMVAAEQQHYLPGITAGRKKSPELKLLAPPKTDMA